LIHRTVKMLQKRNVKM